MWVTWVTTPYTACLAAYVGYYHTLCYHIHTYFHTLPYITCLIASLHSYLCGLLATIHFLATVAAIFYTLPPWLVACSPWLLLLINTLPPLPGLLLLPYIASIAWATDTLPPLLATIHCLHCLGYCCYHTLPPLPGLLLLPYIASIAWATVATIHCLHCLGYHTLPPLPGLLSPLPGYHTLPGLLLLPCIASMAGCLQPCKHYLVTVSTCLATYVGCWLQYMVTYVGFCSCHVILASPANDVSLNHPQCVAKCG